MIQLHGLEDGVILGVTDGVLVIDIVGVGVTVCVGVGVIVGVAVTDGNGGESSIIPISNSHSGSVTFTVILPVPLRKGAQ